MTEEVDWGARSQKGYLASGIDPADRRGLKNYYIDLLQKMALEEVLELKGNEVVLDYGCGSGRIAYWIAPKVKKVFGLEGSPEMIRLAEKNRTTGNVEFLLYDGIHFPAFLNMFNIILSVGVLQYMEGETLKKTVLELTHSLKIDGMFCLIEQASDNIKIERPRVEEYLQAFKESKLECLKYYPIRNGRSWFIYLIRYGIIPRNMLPKIARKEILCRRERKTISNYQDYLFVFRKQ